MYFLPYLCSRMTDNMHHSDCFLHSESNIKILCHTQLTQYWTVIGQLVVMWLSAERWLVNQSIHNWHGSRVLAPTLIVATVMMTLAAASAVLIIFTVSITFKITSSVLKLRNILISLALIGHVLSNKLKRLQIYPNQIPKLFALSVML